MKKIPTKRSASQMRAEYDFSTGVRGKYTGQYRLLTNVRFLDPDLVAAFPDSKSVNDAVKMILARETRVK
jgi:hypothetical protein